MAMPTLQSAAFATLMTPAIKAAASPQAGSARFISYSSTLIVRAFCGAHSCSIDTRDFVGQGGFRRHFCASATCVKMLRCKPALIALHKLIRPEIFCGFLRGEAEGCSNTTEQYMPGGEANEAARTWQLPCRRRRRGAPGRHEPLPEDPRRPCRSLR